jgi:hypothetical protein
MVAFIARLLKRYTLELIVDNATLSSRSGDRKAARQKTQDNAIRQMIDSVEFNINIQMLKEMPGLGKGRTGRMVKRWIWL